MTTSRTFRDPDGFVFRHQDRVFRAVRGEPFNRLSTFLDSEPGRGLVSSGKVVQTLCADTATQQDLLAQVFADAKGGPPADWRLLEHEAVFFASYPYEWPPEMLYESGRLTLDLAQECLEGGYGLKDATPYNTLFAGPRPVFVDVLSFERRDERNPLWLPYAQFVRTYLLPLLAERMGTMSLQRVFTASRDGLEPRELYGALPAWKRLMPPYLALITLPTKAERRAQKSADLYQPRLMDSPEAARFVVRSVLKRLRRQLEGLRPDTRRSSTWKDYEATRTHYTAERVGAKAEMVAQALAEAGPETVLDIGANAGEYSAIAARGGAKVVAVDSDPAVVGVAWKRAESQGLDILPLVMDFSRPTPGLGWRNRECPSFLDRAEGRFDAVLMLAVIHHLLVTERIPLPEILDLASRLTRGIVILEYVEPGDPMFKQLARGRDALYSYLTREYFEEECARYFDVVRKQDLEGSPRTMYVLRKRG